LLPQQLGHWPYTAAMKYKAEKVKLAQAGIVNRQYSAGFRKDFGVRRCKLFCRFYIVLIDQN
jgi:hypothetical protein